jgi:transposase InsO family protein
VIAYRFVERVKGSFHLRTLCRVLGVSPSGYRAWAMRQPSTRARRDAELLEEIRAIHAASRGTYGAPRIHAVMRTRGQRVGRKRVARLMHSGQVVGVHRRRRAAPVPRPPARGGLTAPDLVRRRFTATSPDRLWVADITSIPTGEGFVHLAAVVDAFSRRAVGWAMAGHLGTGLVLAALDVAIAARRPEPGLVHHSDRGTQYTSVALGARLAEAGIRMSMGTPGSAYDNALAESFFATLETELIDRSTWRTRDAAITEIEDWMGFYNRARIHSSLDNLAPAEFERRYREAVSTC